MLTDELTDLIRLDELAVRASLDALAGWRPEAGDPVTPCAGWRLSDLVAHLTVQQHGFARAADGERTTLAEWAPVAHDDPLGAYRDACDRVLASLARLTDPAAPVLLPEIAEEPLPAGTMLRFHLVDNVVHAWDAARSLGDTPRLPDDVLAVARQVARAVPDGERRDRPGASFAHRLPLPAGVSTLDETLLLLGRDPGWSPGR